MYLTKKLKVKMVSSVAETQTPRLPAGLYVIYNADVPSSLAKFFWPLQSECIMHERSFLPSFLMVMRRPILKCASFPALRVLYVPPRGIGWIGI